MIVKVTHVLMILTLIAAAVARTVVLEVVGLSKIENKMTRSSKKKRCLCIKYSIGRIFAFPLIDSERRHE